MSFFISHASRQPDTSYSQSNAIHKIIITYDSNNKPQYHVYLKDHLGNNRVVVDQNLKVEQVNHYYPFGGLMAESTGTDVQQYKYNGKELERMNGINLYDYGARFYDPATCRFTTVDPHAEKYNNSPYAYCVNNPIMLVDPTGKDWVASNDGGHPMYSKEINENNVPKGYSYLGKTCNFFKDRSDGMDYFQGNADGTTKFLYPMPLAVATPEGASFVIN